MPRQSQWTKQDRKKLLKLISEGVAEQQIRDQLGKGDKAMSTSAFAGQLRQAMVEAGQIKQAPRTRAAKEPSSKQVVYTVTSSGRLTITNWAEVTGVAAGSKFTLAKPKGRSTAWRLLPVE